MSFSPIGSSSSRPSVSSMHDRISSQVRSSVSAPSAQTSAAAHEQIRNRIMQDSFEDSRPSPMSLDGGVSRPQPSTSLNGTPATPRPSAPDSFSPEMTDVPSTTPTGELDSGPGDNAQVDGWILEAEQRMGRNFTAEEEEAIRVVAYHESRNDPSASNDWDMNAQQGNPSQGLMQVTQSNFQQYNPGGNIFDPVDSIIAAVRYSDERYGGIDKSKGYVDYKNGGATDPYGGWNGGYTWY